MQYQNIVPNLGLYGPETVHPTPSERPAFWLVAFLRVPPLILVNGAAL